MRAEHTKGPVDDALDAARHAAPAVAVPAVGRRGAHPRHLQPAGSQPLAPPPRQPQQTQALRGTPQAHDPRLLPQQRSQQSPLRQQNQNTSTVRRTVNAGR